VYCNRMIIDQDKTYCILHEQTFRTTRDTRALTARHGNLVLEEYTGSPNQLWKLFPSGKIRNETGVYISYDREGIVRVKATFEPPEKGFAVHVEGGHPYAVSLSPQEDETVVIRSSHGSRFVDIEDRGVGGGTWFLVDAKALALFDQASAVPST